MLKLPLSLLIVVRDCSRGERERERRAKPKTLEAVFEGGGKGVKSLQNAVSLKSSLPLSKT